MRVYVALEIIPYEGGYILGIFSTKERAQNRIESYDRGDSYIGYEIEEVNLDTDSEISI